MSVSNLKFEFGKVEHTMARVYGTEYNGFQSNYATEYFLVTSVVGCRGLTIFKLWTVLIIM